MCSFRLRGASVFACKREDVFDDRITPTGLVIPKGVSPFLDVPNNGRQNSHSIPVCLPELSTVLNNTRVHKRSTSALLGRRRKGSAMSRKN